jgi:hypothetical protein
MFTASAGHKYFLGFLGGTSSVAIPHLSLPYTHNLGKKKREIETFLHLFLRTTSPRLMLPKERNNLRCLSLY